MATGRTSIGRSLHPLIDYYLHKSTIFSVGLSTRTLFIGYIHQNEVPILVAAHTQPHTLKKQPVLLKIDLT